MLARFEKTDRTKIRLQVCSRKVSRNHWRGVDIHTRKILCDKQKLDPTEILRISVVL